MSVGDVVSGSSLLPAPAVGAAWVGGTAAARCGPGNGPHTWVGTRHCGDGAEGPWCGAGNGDAMSSAGSRGFQKEPLSGSCETGCEKHTAHTRGRSAPSLRVPPMTHAPWHGWVPRRMQAPTFPPRSHAQLCSKPFPRPRLSQCGAVGRRAAEAVPNSHLTSQPRSTRRCHPTAPRPGTPWHRCPNPEASAVTQPCGQRSQLCTKLPTLTASRARTQGTAVGSSPVCPHLCQPFHSTQPLVSHCHCSMRRETEAQWGHTVRFGIPQSRLDWTEERVKSGAHRTAF